MTNAKLARQPDEERGKIGSWDVLELRELVSAFREVARSVETLITLHGDGLTADDEMIEMVRRALVEVTKGLCGTVTAGAPGVASELANTFFFIHGSNGVQSSAATPPTFEPLTVSVLSSVTLKHPGNGHTNDVALLRLSFRDPESDAAIVDALLVRRDRTTDERRIRHFPSEPGSLHFDRAVECRAQWLGVSDGPFTAERPCS